jgi:hypothetical protein
VSGFWVTQVVVSVSPARRRFAPGVVVVASSSSTTTTSGSAVVRFADGDGCLKKNEVMGLAAFFGVLSAGLPRFIRRRYREDNRTRPALGRLLRSTTSKKITSSRVFY